MKKREDRLYDIGVAAFDTTFGSLSDDMSGVLRAVAAMLAEATKPKAATKRRPRYSHEETQYGERVYQILSSEAPDAMLYEPVSPSSYGPLGKLLTDAGVTLDDIDALVDWLNSGGLSWMETPPTWGQFGKKALDWIGRAKAKGRLRAARDNASAALDELRQKGGL